MGYAKNNKKNGYNREEKMNAYKVVKVNENLEKVANEVLEAALEYADDEVFYADMCDDYKMARAEKSEVWAWADPVRRCLAKRYGIA